MHNIDQSVGFLGRPLLKTGLPLIENVRKSLAKSVLIPLGLKKQNEAKEQKEGFPGMLLGTLFIIIK